jgi:hypothetical protein
MRELLFSVEKMINVKSHFDYVPVSGAQMYKLSHSLYDLEMSLPT